MLPYKVLVQLRTIIHVDLLHFLLETICSWAARGYDASNHRCHHELLDIPTVLLIVGNELGFVLLSQMLCDTEDRLHLLLHGQLLGAENIALKITGSSDLQRCKFPFQSSLGRTLALEVRCQQGVH